MKLKKLVQPPGEKIRNTTFDETRECLYYINGKIKYLIIGDIKPIIQVYRSISLFKPYRPVDLSQFNFNLREFTSEEEWGASTNTVQLFLSALVYWRDNG